MHGRFHEEDDKNKASLTLDVGVDVHDYRPISFDDVKRYMSPREEAFRKAKEDFIAGDTDGTVIA